MRGTIAGKEDLMMDAALEVNPAVEHGYEIDQTGSHTLQSEAFEDIETRRARLIEATVQALADGSAPRLARSRALAQTRMATGVS